MNVALAYVGSANAKITERDNSDVKSWSSEEDGKHFMELVRRSDVVIMDSSTFKAAGVKPEAGKLRVVTTRTPEDYQDKIVEGQLEFSSETPEQLMGRLATTGAYDSVLLAGGPRLSADWINAGLVRDFYLTIEPKLFAGREMMDGLKTTTPMHLESVKQLNEQGTLLVHYLLQAA